MIDNIPDVSERIEARELKALHAEASDGLRDRLGLSLGRIDGAMVSIAANDPSILLNRTMGLGLTRGATEEGIERIRATYHDHGVEQFYVGVHPEVRPDRIEQYLANAGLESASIRAGNPATSCWARRRNHTGRVSLSGLPRRRSGFDCRGRHCANCRG